MGSLGTIAIDAQCLPHFVCNIQNYPFVKEIYTDRHTKMADWMENVEKAIARILADKVYTSAEFEREEIKKMAFTNSRNLDGRKVERREERSTKQVGNSYQEARRPHPNRFEDTSQS